MSKSLKLIKGRSYVYAGKKFMLDVVKPVDKETFEYLMGTGRFVAAGVQEKEDISEKKSGKLKIKKPDETVPVKEENVEIEIPVFKSKKKLVQYALEEYGFKFEDDLKEVKMVDIREQMSNFLKVKAEEKYSEKTIEV